MRMAQADWGGRHQKLQGATEARDRGAHFRMVDPIKMAGPQLPREDRASGIHDLSVDEHADALPSRQLDIFKSAS